MNHTEIVSYLIGKQIPKKFAKVVPWRVFDDFEQYCYCELLKIDAGRLTGLYNAGKLEAFFFHLCKRQAINPRSGFYTHCGELPMLTGRIKYIPLDYQEGEDEEVE